MLRTPDRITSHQGERPRAAVTVAAGAGVAVLLAVAPNASAAAACPDGDARPATMGLERTVAAVGCLVNHERTAAGLGTVSLDPRLRTAAQRHADDMAARGYFAHNTPEGIDPGTRITAAGYIWSAYGENLAAGQQAPTEAMAAWLDSPSHCAALMTPRFTAAGYGIASGVQGPYWVQEFASPAVHTTTSSSTTPDCPRAPASRETTVTQTSGSAAPVAGASSARVATTNTGRTRVRARRSGRKLHVVAALPSRPGTAMTVTLRVRQNGRTLRSWNLRRPAGTTQRLVLPLSTAGRGRVSVKAGSTRTVVVRFS